jgi:hypothetical protein
LARAHLDGLAIAAFGNGAIEGLIERPLGFVKMKDRQGSPLAA